MGSSGSRVGHDRLGMGLALTSLEERGPTVTGPGRKAGTDHGARLAGEPGHGNSRRLPPGAVRKGRSGKREGANPHARP
jgi:hypothetical protein